MQQKLENLADQGCNILPKSLRDDCTSFVKSNVDALIDILEQELQPDNICPALRLCDGKFIIFNNMEMVFTCLIFFLLFFSILYIHIPGYPKEF